MTEDHISDKRHGLPKRIGTDKSRSFGAAKQANTPENLFVF
ncbi:MAG: hypothetical protein P8L68_13885 [Paracoccaceae bacterium]|nr:hypothetical protein [Paracoccaceae bacterium]